jgi:hypothetical protein
LPSATSFKADTNNFVFFFRTSSSVVEDILFIKIVYLYTQDAAVFFVRQLLPPPTGTAILLPVCDDEDACAWLKSRFKIQGLQQQFGLPSLVIAIALPFFFTFEH